MLTLAQLLGMLRGATTPEARTALLAEFSATQRREAYQLALTRATELRALATRSAEQDAEMLLCLDAADGLRAAITADTALEGRFADHEAFDNTPGGRVVLPVAGRGSDPGAGAPGGGQPAANANRQAFIGRWQENPFIARSIIGDLTAYGLRDTQIDHLASRDYVGEFVQWMRSCGTNPQGIQSRALNEVTIDGGAVVVPLDFVAEIIQRRAATKRVSSLVRRIQTSRDSISIPKFLGGDSVKINDLAVQWAGAEGAVTEDTSLEAWGSVDIRVHRGGVKIVADRAWLEDAAFDMEGWIVEQITDMYEAMLEYIIINGSGVGRPFGLVTRTGTTTPAAGLITCDNIGDPVDFVGLISQQGGLSSQYSQNASYLWQRLALYTQVLGILSTTGEPVLGTPSTTTGGTVGRVDTQLLGAPVVQSDYMAAVGAGNKINYYGDFRQAYGLVERVALQIEPLIDPALQLKDQRGWYVRFRLGGDVLAEWAMRCGLNTDHS